MLKGEAKKAYQREYMRVRRAKLKLEGALLDPLTSKSEEVKDIRVCEACDESRVIESHHIDKSHDNQSPENLIDLCPTCHKVLHRQNLTVEELLYKTPVQPNIDNNGGQAADLRHSGRFAPPPERDADGNAIYED